MDEKVPPPVNAVSDQTKGSRSGGRPEYKPTDDQRATVKRMVGEGAKRAAIAAAIDVSRATLRKYFKAELAKPIDQAGQLDLSVQSVVHTGSEAAEPGRPPFEPNYRHREDVRLFKADGWSDDRIARRLRISRGTLTEHFRQELDDGADAVRAEALKNLMASSRKGNVAASNALLKLSGLEPPPPPPKDPPPSASGAPAVEPKPALGKKEQAQIDALAVPEDWHELMNDDAQAN